MSCGKGTSHLYWKAGAGLNDFWNVNEGQHEADIMAVVAWADWQGGGSWSSLSNQAKWVETIGDAKQVPNGMAAGFWGVSL